VGFLNPLFLLAAAALAVPLILHLFQRQESRRLPFPALRYLQKTAKEHARSIRLRQLLLLLLRVATLLLLVLAGARAYLAGGSGGHDPTALAIVLDNSLSSGVVSGDQRVLDQLREVALRSVDAATPDDRIWVILAGTPGHVALPRTPTEAREELLAVELSAGRSDLSGALERASALVRDAGLSAAEIHVLSDLQATALPPLALPLPPDIPVLVYRSGEPTPENRWVESVEVGGGLAPLAGQRTEVVARVGGEGEEEVAVRLLVNDRLVGASRVTPGGAAVFQVGPFPAGRIRGVVEIDPDALRMDDRREFTFSIRPPPRVAVPSSLPFFLETGLAVLEEAGRVVRAPGVAGDVLLAPDGAGVEIRPPGTPAVVVPPEDPTLLPALNRRLAAGGIPWRYEPAPPGESRVGENALPLELAGTRIAAHYRLVPAEGAPPGSRVEVRLEDGEPWMVSGEGDRGRYLLLGSPLDAGATALPVTALMIPLLEWMVTRWAAQMGGLEDVEVGAPIVLPAGADGVRDPGGTVHPGGGTAPVFRPRTPGVHVILAGDSVLTEVAVNVPTVESPLDRLTPGEVRERLGSGATVVATPSAWERAIFPSGRGPEMWRPLLLAALLLLLLESRVAATGRGGSRGWGATPAPEVAGAAKP